MIFLIRRDEFGNGSDLAGTDSWAPALLWWGRKEAGLGRKSGSYKFEKRQKELKKQKKKQEKLDRRLNKGGSDDEPQPTADLGGSPDDAGDADPDDDDEGASKPDGDDRA
jgi:hypothetical protein